MGMSFQEAIELYRRIYHRFEKVEGKPWGTESRRGPLSLIISSIRNTGKSHGEYIVMIKK